MGHKREEDSSAPPQSPYVSHGPGVAVEHSDGDGPDPGEPPTETELRQPFDEEARQELSSMMSACEAAFALMEMPPEPKPAPTVGDLSGEPGEDDDGPILTGPSPSPGPVAFDSHRPPDPRRHHGFDK